MSLQPKRVDFVAARVPILQAVSKLLSPDPASPLTRREWQFLFQ